MCETQDVRVIYLPLYSLDYNSIEKFFFVLKKWMKRHHEVYEDEESFAKFIHLAMNACNSNIFVK